jgi:short-subunit dehydrogenase
MAATLITGASSGIGLEPARVFARNRHDLVLVARTEPKLRELSVRLQARGFSRTMTWSAS